MLQFFKNMSAAKKDAATKGKKITKKSSEKRLNRGDVSLKKKNHKVKVGKKIVTIKGYL
jgi:hypothetical protein